MSFDLISIAAGLHQGCYSLLADHALTPEQLAYLRGANPEDLEPWLEAQYEVGILERTADGRYCLPEDIAEMFTDRDAPCSLVGLAQIALAVLTGSEPQVRKRWPDAA